MDKISSLMMVGVYEISRIFMKLHSVGIIGLGNIGFRHLEGLIKNNVNCEITCFDPDNDVKNRAEKLIKEYETYRKKFSIFECISETNKKFDLIIIATNSDIRLKVLREFFDHSHSDYVILEKVLFQSRKELDEAKKILIQNNSKAWINCFRRKWESYAKVKKLILDEKDLFFSLEGNNWSMASNAIHFLDLFEWLSSSEISHIDVTNLDPVIHEAKRKGFIELSGTIMGEMNNTNRFKIKCSTDEDNFPIKIKILGKDIEVLISESTNSLSIKKNNMIKESYFNDYLLSDLGGEIVKEILTKGQSGLSNFETSLQQHEKLLTSFLKHINKISPQSFSRCPIT